MRKVWLNVFLTSMMLPAALAVRAQPAEAQAAEPERAGAGPGKTEAAAAEFEAAFEDEPSSGSATGEVSGGGEAATGHPESQDQASEEHTGLSIRGAGGFSLPVAITDFSDTYDAGFVVGGEVGFDVGRFTLSGGVYFGHLYFRDESLFERREVTSAQENAPQDPQTNATGRPQLDADGGHYDYWELLLMGRLDVTELAPWLYVRAGGGLALANPTKLTVNLNGEDILSEDQDATLSPIVSGGFGVYDPGGPFALFAEARLDALLTEGPALVANVTGGFMFDL